jgi:hypothetical protein
VLQGFDKGEHRHGEHDNAQYGEKISHNSIVPVSVLNTISTGAAKPEKCLNGQRGRAPECNMGAVAGQ